MTQANLDPPFNSNADYNVLFKEHDGERIKNPAVTGGNVTLTVAKKAPKQEDLFG